MLPPRRAPKSPIVILAVSARAVAAMALVAALLLLAAAPTAASGIEFEARILLGGHARPGAWTAIEVNIANDGPDLRGELRVRTAVQGRSIYGVEADLPSGSRKAFTLYAQPPLFSRSVVVDLVAGGQVLSSQTIELLTHDTYAPIVALVAERPERIQRDILDATEDPNLGYAPVVVTLQPRDLPARVEAWAAIDRLVWQDVDSAQLSAAQLAALDLWLGAGGQLVLLGGSTGPASLGNFPTEILPFEPDRTVNVSTADMAGLLGTLPANATALPAVAGTLREGTVLGRSGDHVFAARLPRGQGVVTLVGIDPATSWLARTPTAEALWRGILPVGQGQVISPLYLPDESSLFYALQNLPAVALPPVEQLLVLLAAYVALIGPVNYFVLRRLDRREWAWVTMPLLVGVFAVGSYGLGAALKGSEVIVNQVAIVRAGQESTRGMGQVYVGIYSPTRHNFDVRVPGGALLSGPRMQAGIGLTEQPVDALFGEATSRLRNFEVGFGVVRGFRAESQAAAPRISANLRLAAGRVQGSVTNGSDMALENVAIVFAGSAVTLPTLAPGATAAIDMLPTTSTFYYSLSERIFGSVLSRDPAEQRKITTRRAVVDQVAGTGGFRVGGLTGDVPVLLAWQPVSAIGVELPGERPNRVGDSLYIVPLSLAQDRDAVFDDPLLLRTIVDGDELGWGTERNSYYLGRGTLVVGLRPAGLSGRFEAGSLELALARGTSIPLDGSGVPVAPLPDEQQPDQDDPVGPLPSPVPEPVPVPEQGAGDDPAGEPRPVPPKEPPFDAIELPAVQLFDHRDGRWYEFPDFTDTATYVIQDAARWVDQAGRVLIRFVNRSDLNEQYFTLSARMAGTIE